jgi:hypothetical protein
MRKERKKKRDMGQKQSKQREEKRNKGRGETE